MESPANIHQQSHPQPLEYVKIAVVLAAITVGEVGVYYVESLRSTLVPILIPLSGLKFSLVVLYFMHLKFDNRLFSILFVGGLALAGTVLLALLLLFLFARNLAGQAPVAASH